MLRFKKQLFMRRVARYLDPAAIKLCSLEHILSVLSCLSKGLHHGTHFES